MNYKLQFAPFKERRVSVTSHLTINFCFHYRFFYDPTKCFNSCLRMTCRYLLRYGPKFFISHNSLEIPLLKKVSISINAYKMTIYVKVDTQLLLGS